MFHVLMPFYGITFKANDMYAMAFFFGYQKRRKILNSSSEFWNADTTFFGSFWFSEL